MVVVWTLMALLVGLVGAKAVKRQEPEPEHELFISLNGKGADNVSVSQCDDLEVTFGGGVPPYTLGVWAEDQQAVISGVNMETDGVGIWSIQSGPTKLALNLKDSAGGSVQSQSVVVLPGTESCYNSTPVIRMGNQPSGTPSNLAPGSLEDCRKNGPATCKFTKNGQSEIFSQQILMGNIFANCHSTEPVKQTFTGSTTITDNWSVSVNAIFGLPVNRLEVTTEISREESRTVTQSFQWDIKPGQQTALVAVGKFNGIYGGMDLKYSNGTRTRITDAVYFQSTGEKATVTRLDISCGENWPSWNATTETNGSGTMRHYGSYGLGVLALLLTIAALS